jgi:AraC-like DNA-binding protein
MMTFDEYQDAIRHVDVDIVLTHAIVSPWRLRYSSNGLIDYQFGGDGGGSIVQGKLREDRLLLIFKTEPSPSPVSLNGIVTQDGDIVILGPSSHFVFASNGPRNWIAVTIPVKDPLRPGVNRAAYNLHQLVFPSGAQYISRIVDALMADDSALSNRDALSETIGVVCDEILSYARPPLIKDAAAQHYRYQEIFHNAVAIYRDNPLSSPDATELAKALNVSPRALLRAFRRMVLTGPARYIMLRRLNMVRRMIRHEHCRERSLTKIAADCGISELGRFAGQYKKLFGELPSETLRRVRLQKTDAVPPKIMGT